MGDMKAGTLVAGLVAVGGLGAVVAAFLGNASPYVTVAEAKTMRGDNLHLAGDIVPGSLDSSVPDRLVRFQLKDQAGQKMTVVYRGAPPANMGSATKVVAVGGSEGSEFRARKLLLKCPSKYESEK